MKVTELPFFQHVRWRPDAGELRKFAISMLVGFALLGLLAAWRAGEINKRTIVLWGIGVALAAAALVPRLGRGTYFAVYLPTSIIGYLVSHIVLALIFFLVFTPMALILSLMGKDLLQLRSRGNKSRWRRVEGAKDANSYYHQF